MIIETRDDLDTILVGCGCCQPFLCDAPDRECESALATYVSDGAIIAVDGCLYMSDVRRWLYTLDGVDYDVNLASTNPRNWDLIGSTCGTTDIAADDWRNEPPDGATINGTENVSWSNQWTWAAFLPNILANFASIINLSSLGCTPNSECYSRITTVKDIDDDCDFPTNLQPIYVSKSRFRWEVPTSHDGAYYKITWDVLEELDGWDDPSPPRNRSFLSQDNVWEWSGPGDPLDPDSWKSGWYELPLPSTKGEVRVVNIRYECYRDSRNGVAPQVTGEAIGDDEL